MEIRERQILFWQILAIVTLIYTIVTIMLLLYPLNNAVAQGGALAYILGGILGTWLITAPIVYKVWFGPRTKAPTSGMSAIRKAPGRIQMDAKGLHIRYRFSLLFFAFFILVMLVQLFVYGVWGLESLINGFWFTFAILCLGNANLANIIHQAKLGQESTQQEETERSKRLDRWWIVFLGLAAIWLVVVLAILPGMILNGSRQLPGMLIAAWSVLGMFSYLLYVIRYPRE